MADDPMCPVCRHPKRRHDGHGCGSAGGECVCHLTEADFGEGAPEPTATAAPEPAAVELPPLPRKWSAPLSSPVRPPVPRRSTPADKPRMASVVKATVPTVPAVQPLEPVEVPEGLVRRALMWWDSWYCAGCYGRYFTPRLCCERQAEPVRVLVVPREVASV